MWYQPSTSSSHTSDTRRLLDAHQIRYNPSRNEQHILCPFHDDHQPSMSINLDKGVWYCHTCGIVNLGDGQHIANTEAQALAFGACLVVRLRDGWNRWTGRLVIQRQIKYIDRYRQVDGWRE